MPLLAFFLGVWLLGAQDGGSAATSEGVAAAKTLYVAADYEEALAAFSALHASAALDEIDQYRALCLLALGRHAEAETIVRALVARNPSFRVSDTDVSPRLVGLVHDIRRQLIPVIVNDRYSSALASFDGKRYAEAIDRFKALAQLLADERAGSDDDVTVSEDLQLPVDGFLKLAEAALEAEATAARAAARAAERPADAVASSSVPAVETRDEKDAIAGLVQRYTQAYEALDAGAVVQLLRIGDRRALEAAFKGLKSQSVEARDVTIALDADGQTATVTLLWIVDAVPKVGSARKLQMPTQLRVLKTAGEWNIVERR
jgi:tetratricopeptide (TPR) repeat protein